MPLLTVANVGHAFATHVVLDGASLSIDPGEKIGMVGRNGQGKSTLMKIVLGEIVPDHGSVQFARGARVGYLSQDPRLEAGDTVRESAGRAFAELRRLHAELDGVFEAMASADAAELERLLARQATLEGGIEAAGGYAVEHRVEATLHGLGFEDDQLDQPVESLSGGQKARLGLARLLLEQPDLLLLDEPTNHLDIAGRRWLEDFLADEYPGAVVVVSHDRWLLDRVVSRIVEVEQGAVREYPGTYHEYIELRRERMLVESRRYEKQLDKIRAEEAYIRKYKAGQRAKQARGRESRLERFKRDELGSRPIELDVMRLEMPKPPRVGDVVLAAEHLTKRFGELQLFDDFSISIRPGDRIGIIGPNGAGKTTLVRCLLGDLEADEGSVRRSPRLSVGWFRQNQDHIDRSLAIWQYLQSVIVSQDDGVRASEQQARDLAGAFLFSGPEQDKILDVVSGGERARAVLAGLVCGAHNLLVLDEPTNHLDIPSAERLEQALLAYGDGGAGGAGGALLLISHDRALLEATCSRLIVLDGDGGARIVEGHYSDLLAQEKTRANAIEAAKQANGNRPVGGPRNGSKSADRSGGRQSAKSGGRQKPRDRTPSADPLARLSTTKLETRIEEIETRVTTIDAELMDPDCWSDHKRSTRLQEERQRLQQELEPLEFEWARRAEEQDA